MRSIIKYMKFSADLFLSVTVLAGYFTTSFSSNSEEAKWSGSALFVIQYVNLYKKYGLNSLIGWQLEVGVAS